MTLKSSKHQNNQMRKAKKNPTKQTKTSRCNWQKKSLHLQQSFLYISLPLLLQRETSELHVLWRKCRMCTQKNFVAWVPARFFSLPLIFALLSARSSYFIPAVYHVVLPKKFVSFAFFKNLSSSSL